jgi:hypothetical protein
VSVQGVGVDFQIDLDFASPQLCETCTKLPIQWEPGALSLRVERPGREADHLPPSSTEVKGGVELYPYSPSTPSWRGAQLQHRDNFTFAFFLTVIKIRSQDSSFGVALGYGIDDQGSIPGWRCEFFSLPPRAGRL